MSALARFNSLPADEARAELLKCCGARRWAEALAAARPFRSPEDLAEAADRVWWQLSPADWLEAFRAHPKIGERKAASEVSEQARAWSEREQSGAGGAPAATLSALAAGNRAYEERFGFIFIVCASGKSADQMLSILEARLRNDAETELRVAAEEQRQITRLRLGKLLESFSGSLKSEISNSQRDMSAITTHVLDTARGRPAAGVAVLLEAAEAGGGWRAIGRGRTDADGRLRDLLPAGQTLSAGAYRLTFGTGDYFAAQGAHTFYPSVTVAFVVSDAAEHYHVPLLVSPYGYSTYRGS